MRKYHDIDIDYRNSTNPNPVLGFVCSGFVELKICGLAINLGFYSLTPSQTGLEYQSTADT